MTAAVKQATSVEPCWCGEDKNGEAKHRRRGESGCTASIENRRKHDRERRKDYEYKRQKVRTAMARWKPGTDILVEEVEQL